jgi:hypothetical protein
VCCKITKSWLAKRADKIGNGLDGAAGGTLLNYGGKTLRGEHPRSLFKGTLKRTTVRTLARGV